jgi:YD repeat-containing protein
LIAYDIRKSSALIVKHPPEENRLISVAVSGQTTTFIYDGDGNLVKKIKPDGSKTIYPSTTPRKQRLRSGQAWVESMK